MKWRRHRERDSRFCTERKARFFFFLVALKHNRTQTPKGKGTNDMQWIWIASGHTAISSHEGFVPPKSVSTGKRVGRRCVPYLAFPSMDACFFFFETLASCIVFVYSTV
jgi:hypothetical protein